MLAKAYLGIRWKSYSPREPQALPVSGPDQQTRTESQALTKCVDYGHAREVREMRFVQGDW